MPARALPWQLDVGSDGPQPWLGVEVGPSDLSESIHVGERVIVAGRHNPDRLLCVSSFIPEVIQVDCRA